MSELASMREKANNLPLLPGVYLMKDAESGVIYVGKAKKLKNRVSSYFHGDHLPKVAAMIEKIADFDVIVASSEFEALVLENSLIKRHRPHYNILLKDDKGYPFLRMDTLSPYPRITLSNRAASDGARYFGPFGGRGQSFEIINVVSRALGLPTCTRKFPRDIGRDRPCLQFQLGKCRGWCRGEPGEEEYRLAAGRAALILEGRSHELTAALTREMESAAEALRFEEAARCRDELRAVGALTQRQKVIAAARADTDAVGFQRGARCCFSVLHYTDGDLAAKDYTLLPEPMESDAEALSELLRQYYINRSSWPRVILLAEEAEDAGELEQWLTELSGHKVTIETPRRGDRAAFLEAAQRNAREEILRATTQAERRSKTLEWLQKLMGMESFPRRIEAYDISNTGDFGVVAAMTVHVDGKPLKKAYRKFRMKELDGQNDYGAMRETLTRRFRRYLDGDERFAELPDALFIDGGAEHARTAREALAELGLTLPIYGMVKDDRHRTRALVTPQGQELGIQSNPAAFALVGRIQEETHRFAIEYHRSLRDSIAPSSLEKIRGVGAKRRQALLEHFGTIRAIRAASPEALGAVVPRDAAQAIYDYYHAKETEE